MERERLIKKDIKTAVVKIGSALLTSEAFDIDRRQIERLVNQVVRLSERGVKVVLVTSGAIVSGMAKLKITTRPKELPFLQSCAAIGQNQLMRIYDEYFSKEGFLTAQVLLTADDLSHRKRYLNARNTILTLLYHRAIPIINENDTVSVEEIKFGDNDKLAALVATSIQADMLIILSTVEGLCSRENKKIEIVERITNFHKDAALGPGKFGSGGMITKLEAAKIASDSSIYTVIADGRRENVLLDVIDKKNVGTIFLPAENKLAARKKWIAYGIKLKGTIIVDSGAKEALLHKGKSLLSAGVKKVMGVFAYGDSVILSDEKGKEFAKGLVNYSSEELDRIKGKKTSEIEGILGYKYYDEVVHRDNLVLLEADDVLAN